MVETDRSHSHRSFLQPHRWFPPEFIWLPLLVILYPNPTTQVVAQQIFTTTSPSLANPHGIALDSSGNIFIANTNANQVVKLNAAGVRQQIYTTTSPALNQLINLAVDGSGNLYIADTNNNRVVKLDSAGSQQQVLSTTSPSLAGPRGISVDSSGNVYIADTFNNRVVKLDASGTQQQVFTTTSPAINQSYGIAVDSSDNVYIADRLNNRVVKLDASGTQQQVFTTTSPSLNGPTGIALDSSGNVYIADRGNNQVVKLDASGNQQQVFTTTSPTMNQPFNIAIDGSDNVYIIDSGNNRVLVFAASGSVVGDPQFTGFQGQHFHFHGTPNEYFSLVSTQNFFINARFIYLSSRTAEIEEQTGDQIESDLLSDAEGEIKTAPFSHPGTYVDQLSLGMAGVRIELHAGSRRSGLDRVSFNGKLILPGERLALPLSEFTFLHFENSKKVTLSLGIMTLEVTNSDRFFNLDARLSDWDFTKHGAKHVSVSGLDPETAESRIASSYPQGIQLHGLLGQTWRNIEYNHKRVYQGEADDYLVGHLFDPNFVYSLFEEKI